MIGLVLLVVIGLLIMSLMLFPGLTVLALVAFLIHRAVKRRRSRFDTFVRVMLG